MDIKTVVVLGVVGCIGYFLGSYQTEVDYQKLLLEQANQYKTQIEEIRKLENQWKIQAQKADEDYKEKLAAIQQSNDNAVNGLRQQLDDYSRRMSQLSKAANKSNAGTREARVSKETKRLVDFSVQCASRLDETIIQLKALQEWIKNND